MSIAEEINNKEKILAELMVKILKEPLNPLESSIKELKDGLLDTQDKIAEINEILGNSIADQDKINKTLRKIRDEAFLALASSLQEYILNQAESSYQKFVAVLNAHSNHHNENLQSVSDTLLETLAKTTIQQNELREFIGELDASLNTKFEAMQVVTQSTLNEIQLSRDLSERSNEDLTVKLDKNRSGVSTKLNDVCIEIQSALKENLLTEKETLEKNQIELIEILSQQNLILTAEITTSRSKLKSLTITTSIFYTLMLIYAGYQIWGSFS